MDPPASPRKSYFMADTGSRGTHTIFTRSSSSNSFPTDVSARNAWLCIKQVTGFGGGTEKIARGTDFAVMPP
jgi:hypothetical protein